MGDIDSCVKYPSDGRRVMMLVLKEKMMIFLLFVLRLQVDCYSNLFFHASGLVTRAGGPDKCLFASRESRSQATRSPAFKSCYGTRR